MVQVKLPGKGDTLIYADIGPSHSKRSLKPIHIDEQRVVYSVLNHASLQQPMAKKPEHDKTDHYSIGECAILIIAIIVYWKMDPSEVQHVIGHVVLNFVVALDNHS